VIEMWRSPWLLLEDGYVACAVIYQDGSKRVVLQHREVAEQALGRKLTRDEVVHHENRDKADNRVENLRVMTRAEHAKLHAAELREGRRLSTR
jgi:hypothetical protein